MCEASEHVAFVPLDVDTPLPGQHTHLTTYCCNSHRGIQERNPSGSTYPVMPLTQRRSQSDCLKPSVIYVPNESRNESQHFFLSLSSIRRSYRRATDSQGDTHANMLEHDCEICESARVGRTLRWCRMVIRLHQVRKGPKRGSYVLKTGDSLQESSSSGPITDITNEDFVQGASNSPSKQPSTELETTSKSKSFTDGMRLSWNPTGLLLNCVNEDTGLLSNSTPEKQSDTTLSRSTTEPLSVLTDLSCSPVAKASSSSRDVSNTTPADDDQTKIPSSNTPSPIKLPRHHPPSARRQSRVPTR